MRERVPTTSTAETAAPTAFSDAAWERAAGVRAAIDRLPFLVELADGTLPRATFTYYMAQDAHYLADYARALAICAAQATDPDDVVFWSRSACGAVLVERQLHAGHVVDLTTAQKSPTGTAYTSYLLALGAAGCYPALAAGILPCFWIYEDVGTRLKERVGDLGGHPYGDWIGTYGDQDFAESTRHARQIVDRLAEHADDATLARMHAAFHRAAQYEWLFWDAAHRRETWPV